jgi:hypothetical protein
MSIKLNGSTSGSVELDVPAAVSGGDIALTLPTTVGSAGQYLRNTATPGTLEFGAVSDIAILQVRTTFKTNATSFTSTSSSFGDLSGLSVSITPASTSNKVLVVARVSVSAATSQRVALRLKRDGSVITAANNQQTGIGNRIPAHSSVAIASGNNMSDLHVTYLDSPSTTSATTYQIMGGAEGGATIYVNQSQTNSDSDSVYLTTSFVSVFEIDGAYVS